MGLINEKNRGKKSRDTLSTNQLGTIQVILSVGKVQYVRNGIFYIT